MVTTRPPKTIVKPTALGPVANTDTKLLIYGLFQKGRVLAQDGLETSIFWVGQLVFRLCLLFIHPPAHGSEVGPAARNTLDSARIPRASKLLICGLFQKVRVLAQDGREIIGTGLIAGNIRRYGPRYKVTPDARLEEAKLDVVIFKGTNRRDYLRYLAGVLGHFHLKFRDVEHFKTEALTIDVDSGSDVRFQLDGEPAGYAPLVLGVRDKALAVVLPSHDE